MDVSPQTTASRCIRVCAACMRTRTPPAHGRKPDARAATPSARYPGRSKERSMLNRLIRASAQQNGTAVCADFDRDTGRLRVFENGALRFEWFPPHSWFMIASVAGFSKWGCHPGEQELEAVLRDVLSRRPWVEGAANRSAAMRA
jgi:hypothetical protein